jgi:hypothetical protein
MECLALSTTLISVNHRDQAKALSELCRYEGSESMGSQAASQTQEVKHKQILVHILLTFKAENLF